MKYYLKFVLMSAAMVLHGFCIGGVPLEWTRRPDSTTPANFTAHQGETLEFCCTFRGFGELPFGDGGDVRLYFQTNGMEEAWWSAPATVSSNEVRAVWGPEMDVGASRWVFFFGTPGVVYSSAIVRLVPSPGFAPGTLPPPAVFTDAVAAIVTNEVITIEYNYISNNDQIQAALNKSKDSISVDLTDFYGKPTWRISNLPKIDGFSLNETITPFKDSDKIAFDWAYYRHSDGNFFNVIAMSEYKTRNSLGLARMSDIKEKLSTNNIKDFVTEKVLKWTDWVCSPSEINGQKITLNLAQDNTWEVYIADSQSSIPKGNKDSNHLIWTRGEWSADDDLVCTRQRILENAFGLATLDDLDDKADASVTNDIEKLKTESTLVYRLFSGSNIVMEVTNYNSRVNPPAMKLMRLNDKGIYEVMWTETNGLERTYNRAASNTAEQVAALEKKAAETYAPRGWSVTTSGLGADAPKDTTWISTPTTVIAGGLEYSKVVTSSGQLWFLRSNGMVANVGGNSGGYFDISASDGTSVFSIEKTDSYMAPVDADGISVRGDTVEIRLSVVSADHPFLRYAPTLKAPVAWQKEEDGFSAPIAVSWSGSSGAWVATVTTTAKEGFFQFEFFQEGGTKIKSGGAMDVSTGGILCTDGIHKCRPVYNSNGTITWEVF